jgi:hypothetical protein
VIQRQGDGFPLDQRRVAYPRHLRHEHRRSPCTEADAAQVVVKTELLKVRLMQRRRELVLRADADAQLDQIAGMCRCIWAAWQPAARATSWSGATSTRSWIRFAPRDRLSLSCQGADE